MAMSMSMTLKFKTVAQFFFMNWQTETLGGLIVGCFCCMVLAFIMMALPQIRKRLLAYFQNHKGIQNSKSSEVNQQLLNKKQKNRKQKTISFLICLIHSFLHVVLMVIIMNMNFYVIVSTIIGASLGYFASFSDECPRKEHKCCQQIIQGELNSVINRNDQSYR